MLDITLFGQLEIKARGNLLPPFPTKKSKGLFAYLVTNRGHLLHREVLAGMFWGDQADQSARKCLRTAIWRIRSIIEPPGVTPGTFLMLRDDALAFSGSADVRVDIEQFERRIASVIGRGGKPVGPFEYRCLLDAVRLYHADFMEGVYDEWAQTERGRLRSLLRLTFERLIDCCEGRQDWSGAVMWSERLLALDPFLENAHRALMRFQCLAGCRPAALRAFDNLCRLLKSEFGIPPMAETFELYETIRSGGAMDYHQPGLSTDPRMLRKARFETPTVRPLVVMQGPAPQVSDLIPSPVFASVTRPQQLH